MTGKLGTQLFGYARTLVRWAEEKDKPNEKRLAEFGDSGQETLKLKPTVIFVSYGSDDETERYERRRSTSSAASPTESSSSRT